MTLLMIKTDDSNENIRADAVFGLANLVKNGKLVSEKVRPNSLIGDSY